MPHQRIDDGHENAWHSGKSAGCRPLAMVTLR
jgi:hypothetical protein